MNLQNFIDYLELKGLGMEGENIFQVGFPVGVTEGILLRPRLRGNDFNHYIPGLLKFTMQVIVRSKTYESGEAVATQVVKALSMTDKAVGDWQVNYCRPQNVPSGFPITPSGIKEFNTDFDVCVVDNKWNLGDVI